MSAGGDPPSGLGPFFGRLREVLGELDAAGVRARVLEYARSLDEVERHALLSALETPPAERAGTTAGSPAEPDLEAERLAGEPLLREIDAFVERLEEGEYYEGWGWDHDLGRERAWGDESWAREMDDLLGEADRAFLDGDPLLAAEAYRALFGAFRLHEDGHVFPGPESPGEMVDTDLRRAAARYLRAVYIVHPAERRAGEILRRMKELSWVADEVTLEDVLDSDAEPLPDFEAFLSRWTDALESDTGGPRAPYGWSRTRDRLLREAVGLAGGVDGLGELAGRRGARDPEAYHEWIEALLAGGRRAEALDAALEGEEAVRDPHERARLADSGALLAEAEEEWETALGARRRAWRAEPTGPRLLALAAALEEVAGDVDPGLQEEADALREGRFPGPARLAAAVELLTGRYEDAAERLRAAEPLGWSRRDHPGYVALPCLLVAGCGEEPPEESVLAGFWERMLPGSSPWELDFGLPPAVRDIQDESPLAPSDFGDLVRAALGRHPPEAGLRPRLLDAAAGAGLARTRAILSNQHRRAYRRAADAAAAVAEGRILAGERERGEAVLVELRQEYFRYSAFLPELRAAVSGSPLLRHARPLLD